MNDRVVVGIVGRPHALDGTVVVHPETDHPNRFSPGSQMYTDRGARLTVRSARAVQGILLVRFREIGDRSEAEHLRGALLTIGSDQRRTLGRNEFWAEDLIGLEVRDPEGARLGSVASVEVDTPQPRIVVVTAKGEFQVPLVAELVPEVDVQAGYVVVNPIAGLIER
jgi:16S rRNA processing protein RimM